MSKEARCILILAAGILLSAGFINHRKEQKQTEVIEVTATTETEDEQLYELLENPVDSLTDILPEKEKEEAEEYTEGMDKLLDIFTGLFTTENVETGGTND